MKKYTLALVIASAIVMTSCGGGETSAPATTDSTAVDSTIVKADSAKVDSTKTVIDSANTK